VLTSFNHDHLKLAKQQMPELQVGALLFGAVETLALPKGTWETLGLQNGLDEDEDEDDFPQLPVPTVENMDEENCRELTRWVNDKYSMLQAAFPNESLSGILSKLNRQRDPAQYIQTLDFPVEWVSCEYHTAYKKVSMVQKLHDLGVKTAFWTVDTEAALKDLWPLQPDAIVTNRPDRVREWSGELETDE
jgi:glycerophosphoryl diester phosphodiesterase